MAPSTTFRFGFLVCVLAVIGCADDDASVDAGNEGAKDASRDAAPDVDAGMPACAKQTAMGFVDCVEQERIAEDLTFVAQERHPGSAHWQAVQDLCAERFEEAGFEVELHDYGSGINVIGRKPAKDADAEEVLVSAHYDSIGDGCPGADDNATGVVAVLELARLAKGADFSRTLVLACWDEEELGLIGSLAYAKRAREREEPILVAYSVEMIGFTDEMGGDFLLLVPDTAAIGAAHAVQKYGAAVGLPVDLIEATDEVKVDPNWRDLQRSDHAAFWKEGYPAMMLTDTSNFRNDNYHCLEGFDSVDTLDIEFLTHSVQAIAGSVAELLGHP